MDEIWSTQIGTFVPFIAPPKGAQDRLLRALMCSRRIPSLSCSLTVLALGVGRAIATRFGVASLSYSRFHSNDLVTDVIFGPD